MAESLFMSVQPDVLLSDRSEDDDYLLWVSQFVLDHRSRRLTLKKPAGAVLKIASLQDTIYNGKQDEVKAWGKFYLPDIVNMRVFGVVKGSCCPCDQLVLMTCEDESVYGYDGEELHLVATSLQQLILDEEIEYPASKSYYNGEAFEAMSDKDWNRVKMGAVGKRLDQEHQRMVEQKKQAFLQSLKSGAHS